MYSMIKIPFARVGTVGPDDLNDVRVMDLAKCADLASHGVITGRVVEQLQGPLFAFDNISDSIDP